MSLSYIVSFNLNINGDDAEHFLTRAAREWPALYAEIKGVQGTALLANAFGLSGPYTYEWRVDFDSFRTLGAIDAALKSDDPRWRRARSEWFERRTDFSARLLRVAEGVQDYTEGAEKGGLLHLVLPEVAAVATDAKARAKRTPAALAKASRRTQVLDTLLHTSGARGGEVWARFGDIGGLDAVGDAFVPTGAVTSPRLFGELREVNGLLAAGA